MEKIKYDEQKKLQRVHWWFVGKHEIVLDIFDTYCHKSDKDKILDVGCGMGFILEDLHKEGEVFGMDMEKDVIDYCRSFFDKKYDDEHIKQGSLPYDIPFDESFDTVIALDVLEHVEDDKAAVKAIYNKLKTGGRLLATVPALMSLWSYNDNLTHHYRRYEYDEFYKLITDVGFKIKLISFYNSKLLLPVFAVRRIKKLLKKKSSDVSLSLNPCGRLLNNILKRIFVSELKQIKGKGYKKGVSLILVAEK